MGNNISFCLVVEKSLLHSQLFYSIYQYLKIHNIVINKNQLKIIINQTIPLESNNQPSVNIDFYDVLTKVMMSLGLSVSINVVDTITPLNIPIISYHHTYGIGVINYIKNHQYLFETKNEKKYANKNEFAFLFNISILANSSNIKNKNFKKILFNQLKKYKITIVEAVIASLLINILALFISLFSMQIYDRVIPTGNQPTLVVLTIGVAFIVLFEMMMKFARSKVMDNLITHLDYHLSWAVFERLLAIRIDKLPRSVGSMAAQLRGYEQIRAFFASSTLFVLVDVPMSLLFVVIIAGIASVWVAMIPVMAAVVGVAMGLIAQKHIHRVAIQGVNDSYKKTGLLVEAVEGIETIKAGNGQYQFLSRWLSLTGKTIDNDLAMRHANDYLSYSVQSLQQVSYISMVVVGSLVVIHGGMTMGGLIASTILGGRILSPVMALPNLIVQYSHAKASKDNLEKLFSLPKDNQDTEKPLFPSRIFGDYLCHKASFVYAGNDKNAIDIDELHIKAGERIAVLGGIGSGKSTLLKLLSGLYCPTQGQILLDGLDMKHIGTDILAGSVGYLQQDHRLFEGTLRQNLLIGMPTPSDDDLNHALRRTGLHHLVANHTKGLDLPISEGGRGISGGQKQLVAFTRLVLTNPDVWLLDEPTASMDNAQEMRCLSVLAECLSDPSKTLVVATHKMSLLQLVDRIIIIADQKIVMDGSKEAVLTRLLQNEKNQN